METLRGIYEAVELNNGEIFDFRLEQIKANKANFNLPDLCHIVKECKTEQNRSKSTPTGYYHYVLGFEYFYQVESIKQYTRDLIDRQSQPQNKKNSNGNQELKLRTVTISTYNPFSQLDVRFTVQVQDLLTQRKENSESRSIKLKETKTTGKEKEKEKQKQKQKKQKKKNQNEKQKQKTTGKQKEKQKHKEKQKQKKQKKKRKNQKEKEQKKEKGKQKEIVAESKKIRINQKKKKNKNKKTKD